MDEGWLCATTEDSPAFLVAREGGVLSLTFNRPDLGNSTPPEAVPLLTKLFINAQNDPAVRCIIISGRGKHFSTGGDVNNFSQEVAKGADSLKASFSSRMVLLKTLVEAIAAFDRPIVAAVRGGVAGAGLLYTLAADMVIGDETAFFLFAHQKMGLSPDGGVSFLLPRAVGFREATRLLLTAAKVEANEAKRIGLLNSVVSPDKMDAEVATLVKQFARAPQLAMRRTKALLNSSRLLPLAAQLDIEMRSIVECVVDPDFVEGVNAFVEKRAARFPSAS